MLKILVCLLSLLLMATVNAAELMQPGKISDPHLRLIKCIQDAKSQCINNFCVGRSHISSNRNCQEICENKAKQICK